VSYRVKNPYYQPLIHLSKSLIPDLLNPGTLEKNFKMLIIIYQRRIKKVALILDDESQDLSLRGIQVGKQTPLFSCGRISFTFDVSVKCESFTKGKSIAFNKRGRHAANSVHRNRAVHKAQIKRDHDRRLKLIYGN